MLGQMEINEFLAASIVANDTGTFLETINLYNRFNEVCVSLLFVKLKRTRYALILQKSATLNSKYLATQYAVSIKRRNFYYIHV